MAQFFGIIYPSIKISAIQLLWKLETNVIIRENREGQGLQRKRARLFDRILWLTSATSSCVTQLFSLRLSAGYVFTRRRLFAGKFPSTFQPLGPFYTCSCVTQRLVAPGELPTGIFYGSCPSRFSLVIIIIYSICT